jgi:hypothetical protein
MKALPKEAVEAIEKAFENESLPLHTEGMIDGATEALTNPEIYEKAGLVSIDDALGFSEWAHENADMMGENDWVYQDFLGQQITTAELFTIYKEQKK